MACPTTYYLNWDPQTGHQNSRSCRVKSTTLAHFPLVFSDSKVVQVILVADILRMELPIEHECLDDRGVHSAT